MVRRNCCRSFAMTDSRYRCELQLARTGTEICSWNSSRRMRCWSVIPRTEANQNNVLPRISSRHHVAAPALGGCVSARPLCAAPVLQLLVGLAVADHRPLLDLG